MAKKTSYWGKKQFIGNYSHSASACQSPKSLIPLEIGIWHDFCSMHMTEFVESGYFF